MECIKISMQSSCRVRIRRSNLLFFLKAEARLDWFRLFCVWAETKGINEACGALSRAVLEKHEADSLNLSLSANSPGHFCYMVATLYAKAKQIPSNLDVKAKFSSGVVFHCDDDCG